MNPVHIPAGDPSPTLAALLAQAKAARRYDIGFPGATDLDHPDLADWLTGQLLNNIGDPWDPGHGRNHTKTLEQQVIDMIGDLLRAPETRWGYVTTGSSEGTEHALDEAWQYFRGEVVVYTSQAAHYSVVKASRRLKLPVVIIRTDAAGRMDVDDLRSQLSLRRERAAMIVATAGTTMTEAVDDVGAITAVCDELAITQRRIHVDAALSGIPLALLPDGQRPAFDFTAGATSMVISGHKFLSTLMPCGVLIYAQSPYNTAGGRISYTGSADTTISGSRSGHTPLILWSVLTRLGTDGHRARAQASRDLANYTLHEITKLGWPASLNPNAFTVVLDTPPPQVLEKWVVPDDGRRAHIVCVPGVSAEQIDEFVSDLRDAMRSPHITWPVRQRATNPAGDGSRRETVASTT